MEQLDDNKKYNINPEIDTPNFLAENIFEKNGTFCRVGSIKDGILEVDLQSLKQKGVEVRNISFAIPLGEDENGSPVKAEMLFMDESIFLEFKDFISKLNWND